MKKILLGNEAIVQGALEAGVNFVATYPGTPASEIGDIFYKIAPSRGIYFEFSTNEKVALEAAMGASFAGLKTLVAMKNFGLNVCQDALLPFIYTGSKGAAVIVVGDDPQCHSSAQTEQDSRYMAYLGRLPILDASDPQECKDFTKLAFEISEKYQVPAMVRVTTRVAHQRMPVAIIQKLKVKSQNLNAEFVRDAKKYITLAPRVLEMKEELFQKIEKIRKFAENSEINFETKGRGKIGVIAAGIGYLHVLEAFEKLDVSPPILKLGFFHPLPEEKIKKFIKGLKKVLVVEEMDPHLEREIERLAKSVNPKAEIIGENIFRKAGELKPEIVAKAIADLLGKKFEIEKPAVEIKIPQRHSHFCEGCPYWLVFSAIKAASEGKNVIYGGDIGCYMLAGNPPVSMQDYLFCMGSGISIGHGISKAIEMANSLRDNKKNRQKVVAFIGDSTFFHAGMPAIANSIANKSNMLVVVLQNQTTAMTGHQPHPGNLGISIENVIRSMGVENLKVIDSANRREFSEAVKNALDKDGLSVIIADRICVLYGKKLSKKDEAEKKRQ